MAVPLPSAAVFHPVNVYSERVNVFVVRLVATLAVWFDIEPIPPLLLKVTVAKYVYNPVPVAVPVGTVTTTFWAAPVTPAGVTAVIVVAFTTTKLVTATPLMVAPVAPVKFVPVMVIAVPPSIVPDVGAIAVTVTHCAYKVVLAAGIENVLLAMYEVPDPFAAVFQSKNASLAMVR